MYKLLIPLMIMISSSLYAEDQRDQIIKKMNQFYNPMNNIRDLSFEIHTNELKSLVESKVTIGKLERLYTKAYWYKDTRDIEIIGGKELDTVARNEVYSVLKQKAVIVWGSSGKKWFEGYEFIKINSGWYIFKDVTGLKNISEFWIKVKKAKLQLIEKKATGSSRTTFQYKKTKWSKDKLVLTNVERKIYEGIQNQHIKSELIYQLYDGVFWLPSELKVKTIQGLAFEDRNKVKREIEENYIFKNYKVNKGRAMDWLSKKSE